VGAHRIEHPGAVLHEPGQDFVDVGHGKRIVGRVPFDSSVRADSRTVPGFAQMVMFAHEQQILPPRAARQQNGDRFGFGKTRQVMKLTILTIGVFDVGIAMPDRCRRQDRNPLLADHTHELAATAREFPQVHASAQCNRCADG